jgi:filamentous hemagglutinin
MSPSAHHPHHTTLSHPSVQLAGGTACSKALLSTPQSPPYHDQSNSTHFNIRADYVPISFINQSFQRPIPLLSPSFLKPFKPLVIVDTPQDAIEFIAKGDHTHTRIEGQQVSMESGGDTTLKGAVVQANQVTAKVGTNPSGSGGNLNIESLQDTRQYQESNKSAGFSVSVPITGGNLGGSVNAGTSSINSNFASVGQQSGIAAGDGGFQIEVKGNTTLTGGVITSTQAAVDNQLNSFTTAGQSASEASNSGALQMSDLQNSASFNAKSSNVGISASGGKLSPSGMGFGAGSASASSVTTAGISGLAGNAAARTGDKETGIAPIFDKEKVKAEVAAQVQITQEAGKLMPKFIADEMGKKRDALKLEAQNETDPDKKAALLAQAQRYDEGGIYRVAAHTALGALGGGTAGALGAAASSAAAPTLDIVQSKLQTALQNAGMSAQASQQVASLSTGALAATLGAAASGGSTAAAATAFNADMNNRQLHPSERQKAKELAAKSGGKYSAEQIEEQMRLMGNARTGQGANTLDIATTPEQNAKRITNDPSMPLQVQGNVVMEVPGNYNADIQQYITENTRQDAGYIPGQSPYLASNPRSGGNTTGASNPPLPHQGNTAACGNFDLDCKSGVGNNLSEPVLTPAQRQAAGDFFAKASTDYQRLAAISAATGNAPVTLSFEIAAGVSGLLEQAFKPSAGKVVVDSILVDLAAKKFSDRSGIPLFMVNEVVERDIKPRLEALRLRIDDSLTSK